MSELKISKQAFVDKLPSDTIRQKVMKHVMQDIKAGKSILKRYMYRYKAVAIPVFSLIMVLGGYLLYHNSANTTVLDQNITQTQNIITELVSMNDNEIF